MPPPQPSPLIQPLTCPLLPHCPVLWLLSSPFGTQQLLTRPQLVEGRTYLCVSLSVLSLILVPPSSPGLCHLSTLSLVCLLFSYSFLLPMSLPLLSPSSLSSLSLSAPSPLHLVSLFLGILFHPWKFSFFVCVSFGVLIPSSPFSSPSPFLFFPLSSPSPISFSSPPFL